MKKLLLLGLAAGAMFAASARSHVKPDISFEDGKETIATNPARGHAGGGWITFKPEGLPKWRGQGGYHSSLWELSRFSGGHEEHGKLPKAERVGGLDMALTAAMKADVRRFLDETRAQGGTLIVRLGYTWSDQAGCEPEDFEVAIGHIRELSQIMRDYEDVIVGVEAGIAGPWGEMHSSKYCAAEYMNRILKTYIDNIGEKIPILVRAPSYYCKLAGTSAEGLLELLPFQDKYLKRIGMYNDGYLGTWWDYGTWAGDFTRERGCLMLKTVENAPYGGEMAYIGRDFLEKNMKLFDVAQWNIVKDWYDCHLNYLRNITERGHTLATFLRDDLVFKVADYRYDGMPKLDEYDGESMSKFVMDHMGYRFVVRDVRLPVKVTAGARNTIAVEIENTGFGKLLLAASAEVLMVKGNEVVAAPAEFELDISGGQKARRGVYFTPTKVPFGNFDFYLRVKADRTGEDKLSTDTARTIRFANAGMWNEDLKANRLGAVK